MLQHPKVGRHVLLAISKPAGVNLYKISKNSRAGFLELGLRQRFYVNISDFF